METGRISGDMAQMAMLKQAFAEHAGGADHIRQDINAKLAQTQWEGPAAERFRAVWEGQFSNALVSLVEALNEAGLEVGNRLTRLVEAGS